MSTLPNSDGEQSVLIIIMDVSEYYKWNYSGTTEKMKRRKSLNSKSQLMDTEIQTLVSETIRK